MNQLDPGDLTAAATPSELEHVYAAMREVLRLAHKGLSVTEIARTLGLTNTEIREAAHLMGFELHEMVMSRDVCPECGWILPPERIKKNGTNRTPQCEICSRRRRIDRMNSTISAEQDRYRAMLDREIDALKQEQRRARLAVAEKAAVSIMSAIYRFKPLYLANPRSRKDEWRAFEVAATALLDAVLKADGGDRESAMGNR